MKINDIVKEGPLWQGVKSALAQITPAPVRSAGRVAGQAVQAVTKPIRNIAAAAQAGYHQGQARNNAKDISKEFILRWNSKVGTDPRLAKDSTALYRYVAGFTPRTNAALSAPKDMSPSGINDYITAAVGRELAADETETPQAAPAASPNPQQADTSSNSETVPMLLVPAGKRIQVMSPAGGKYYKNSQGQWTNGLGAPITDKNSIAWLERSADRGRGKMVSDPGYAKPGHVNTQRINEGGNVFKTKLGEPASQRINRDDVAPTVAWLEQITGLSLMDNMLGSTGQKDTSGDLDLAVDADRVTKDALVGVLTQWCQSHDLDPRDYIRKSGNSVHFLTAIRGNPAQGHVQTDFMFLSDLKFSKWMLGGMPPSSKYKGVDRAVVLNSVAKAQGLTIDINRGLISRMTKSLITSDPQEIAKILVGPTATVQDISSVESIVAALSSDPDRQAKLADAANYMQKQGRSLPESKSASSFARSMPALDFIESLTEGARIEHPEDLVFSGGSTAAMRAISDLSNIVKDPNVEISLKWDGSPAIWAGRRPSDGKFTLNYKEWISKPGGQVTSPDELAEFIRSRGGNKEGLISKLVAAWSPLESVFPAEFRGFLWGDLLYTGVPPVLGDKFVIKPNTVTYTIPVKSALGARVAASSCGIAMHQFISDIDATPQPLKDLRALNQSQACLVVTGEMNLPSVTLNVQAVSQAAAWIRKHAAAIDGFLDPVNLVGMKDLPDLMKKYINSRVRAGSLDGLAQGFLPWIATNAGSANKAARIAEHCQTYQDGMLGIFGTFVYITSIKHDLKQQIDAAQSRAEVQALPAHEGYVIGSGDDKLKLVDRLEFSRLNFAKNG